MKKEFDWDLVTSARAFKKKKIEDEKEVLKSLNEYGKRHGFQALTLKGKKFMGLK